MMSKASSITTEIPELRDLQKKLRDELRALFMRNIGVAMALGSDDPAKRMGIGIALASTAAGTALQMLIVALAGGLDRPVTAAEGALFMVLNDGTIPLSEVLDKVAALIKLATRNGYDMKLDTGFDPKVEIAGILRDKLRDDPEIANALRADPEMVSRLQELGISLDEKKENE